MSQDKKYAGVIVGIADCYVKTAIALKEACAIFHNYAEEAVEAVTRGSKLLSSCGVDEQDLSPMTIQDFFEELNKCDVDLTGTSPMEYGMSIQRHRRQPHIHYNYTPRAQRNLPYQRRAY